MTPPLNGLQSKLFCFSSDFDETWWSSSIQRYHNFRVNSALVWNICKKMNENQTELLGSQCVYISRGWWWGCWVSSVALGEIHCQFFSLHLFWWFLFFLLVPLHSLKGNWFFPSFAFQPQLFKKWFTVDYSCVCIPQCCFKHYLPTASSFITFCIH